MRESNHKAKGFFLLASMPVAAFLISAAVFAARIREDSGNGTHTASQPIPISNVKHSNQSVPLIVLETSGTTSPDSAFVSLLAVAPFDGRRLYAIREDTSGIEIIDQEHRVRKHVPAFLNNPKALAVDGQGRTYVATDSELVITDATGRRSGAFPIAPLTASLATLSDGSVAVAPSEDDSLITLFDPSGKMTRRLGSLKQFDQRDEMQNRFLNLGKVAVSRDEVYYVSMFSPTPVVQKFSRYGQLLNEFAIEGAAVELQLQRVKEFLLERPADTVGGFFAVRSATVDANTGHLWIGMNGSSRGNSVTRESGVLYEYNTNGEKLAEYALAVVKPTGSTQVITDIKDIAVNSPYVHVLTSQGQIHSFNFSQRSAATKKQGQFERRGRAQGTFPNSGGRSVALGFAQPTTHIACPPAQSYSCAADCLPGSSPVSVDCGAVLRSRLQTGEVIINGQCSAGSSVNPPNGGCNGTMTGCDTSGNQVTYSVAINCNAAPTPTPTPTPEPTPTPTPTPTPGSGGGPSEGCQSDFECYLLGCSECNCVFGMCSYATPVVIDVIGNGFDLTGAAGGVNFDLNNDGFARRLAWTSTASDDAWLALDRNGNGTIDRGAELFGNVTPQPQPPAGEERNGFLALAEYDKPENGGNADGRIDRRDAIFFSLRLWQDTNHNGISEPGELHTLLSLDVKAMDLDYRESRRIDQHGNKFRYRAKVYDKRGASVGRWAWDVFLVGGP